MENLQQGSYPTDLEFKSGSVIRSYAKKNLVRERRPSIEDLKNGYGSLVGLSDPDSDYGHMYVLMGATFNEPSDQLRDLIGQLKRLERDESMGIIDTATTLFTRQSPKKKIQEAIDTLASWRSTMLKVVESPEAQMALGQLGMDLYQTESVILLDPDMPDADNAVVVMPGEDFARQIDFVLTASDAKEIAEAWLSSIEVETEQIEAIEASAQPEDNNG